VSGKLIITVFINLKKIYLEFELNEEERERISPQITSEIPDKYSWI
jgi:hypothetical protein